MRKLNCFVQEKQLGLKYAIILKSLLLFLLILFVKVEINSQCKPNTNEISGTVFNDVNFNGEVDIIDEGIADISVYLYDEHQSIVAKGISDKNGNYKFKSVPTDKKYRLEFSFPNIYSLASGSKSVIDVQSTTCGNNLLLHRPSKYRSDNKNIAMSMFYQGGAAQYTDRDVIFSMAPNFDKNSVIQSVVKKSEIGSIWGLAFSKVTQQLFTSAFVKQYVALGSEGIGAIYVSKREANGWNTSLFVDLVDEGIDLGTLAFTDIKDCGYGAQVGNIGIGSIALSEDEEFLYAVNMYSKQLIRVPLNKRDFDNIVSIDLPNPNCVGGNAYPFALKSYKNKIYIGITCGADISLDEKDNRIYIYEYDPVNMLFTEIFTTNYSQGYIHNDPSFDVKVQHWITDIDFTDEGNMVIALNDRTGHRYCSDENRGRLDVQNGDILLVWNDKGIWKLERNGRAGGLRGTGVDNGEGPNGGEFFSEDCWPTVPKLHPETATGSVFALQGSGQIIVPVYDPEEDSYSGGFKRFNTSNGKQSGVLSIYTHKIFPEMGKASGFGDLDVIYDPLPVEIGDRVWVDSDNDGIQDPGEKGIGNLSLGLYDNNCVKLGATKTDENGFYVFNDSNVKVSFLEKYYVVIDDPRFEANELKLNNKIFYLTISNKGIGVNNDKNDSNAKIAREMCIDFDGKPFSEVTVEGSGKNNYSIDFGFSEVKVFDLALRKTIVDNKTVHYGDEVRFKISVFNQGTEDANTIVISDYINKGYDFDISKNKDWKLDGDIATYVYENTLKPGARFDIYISMVVKNDASLNELVNYAEISSAKDFEGNIADDVDSTPDAIKDNDIGGVPHFDGDNSILISDDVIDDDGSFDEDDHDPAMPKILDLALQKIAVADKDIFVNGDTVTFKFFIYNQGNVVATKYSVTDYLSSDLEFSADINPDWKESSDSTVVFEIDEELPPFSKKEISIKLIIAEGANVEEILNYGEISNIEIKSEVNPKDYDSVPNAIKGDDVGAVVGTSTDNQINSSPLSLISDEDDQDVAAIKLYNYDLALVKKALSHNIKLGDTITFEIEVFNQGAITADKITIVDYLATGFVLNDSKWTIQNGNKAEILLSVDNGLLPPVGLMPNTSIKVNISLILSTLEEGVNFLTNVAEIKSSFDIAGNDMSVYDRDSTPDDIKDNDVQGEDNQIDGDGINDEDDHDWATVFVRSNTIYDPCVCLHNATNESNGQFGIQIHIISPSGENWIVSGNQGLYDVISGAPPASPTLIAVGTVLTESVDDPFVGVSTYSLEGVQVDDEGYIVTFVNNLGDTNVMNTIESHCVYEDITVEGALGTCQNTTEVYKIINPDHDVTYTWSLPLGGGSIVGSSEGEEVIIDWGGANGIYDLEINPDNDGTCIAPKLLKVKVGNSSGALAADDYILSSVDTNCEVVVTPELILSSPVDPATPFEVILIDPQGNMLPSNVITSEYIGMDIMVKLIDLCSGQRAMSVIKAADNHKPVVTCEDVEVECDDMTNYEGPVVTDNCDSDPVLSFVNEEIEYKDCNSNYTKVITREYSAVDKWGNVSDVCVQHISVKRLDKSEIVFPQDFVVGNNSALTCNAYETDEDGHPLPKVTGTPFYHGKDLYTICTNNFCETTVGYNDFEVTDTCCVKRIIRTWHVFENCEDITPDNIISNVQTIEITDQIPPIPVAPENMLVTTDGLDCSATVQLPKLDVTDNCTPEDEIVVDIFYAGGNLKNSNGGVVTLPVGENIVNYKVYDKCGNLAEVSLKVKVVDKTPPIAICQTKTIVSLSNNGEADVNAKSFDSGSYDGCGITNFEVRRMFGGVFDETVHFSCDDLDSTDIMVVLKVIDINNNSNECMIVVNVQHKFEPKIVCPDPIVVECDFSYEVDSLGKYFGNAVGIDVCGVDVVENNPVISLTQCGVGNIVRSFTATGRGGLTKSCTQKVEFINSNPFTINDITWPDGEYTTNTCGDDMFSPDVVGRPILDEDQCGLVASSYRDEVFKATHGDACYTIIRTWTVIDDCQVGGIWHFQQIITVNNDINPEITPLESAIDTCTIDEDCQSGGIILEATAQDDCTFADDLQWEYYVDIDNDGTFDIHNSQVGRKAIATGDYPIGTHKILWEVRDGCGNTDTKTQLFTIKNCTKPSPVCKDALIIELGPDVVNGDTVGIAQILADEFDAGSSHSCGYELSFSFSLDIQDSILYLDCSWLRQDEHELKIYVTDSNGNYDYCITHLIVQDNGYVCNPFDRCITYPADSTVIEACDPDLKPEHGFMDSLTVDNSCNCDDFEISYIDKDTIIDSDNCKTIKRTWDVDFNCTDLDTNIYYIQFITLKNVEAPTLNCPSDITINTNEFDCNRHVNIPVPTYEDGCNTGLTITHNSTYADDLNGENASGTYPLGITTVQFTLTDDCSNTSTCDMVVNVIDATNPICVPNDTTVALNSNGVVVITGDFVASESTDNCSILSIDIDPNTFDCGDLGDHTVNITVTDGSNNTSNCDATVTIIDTLTQLCNAHDTILILDGNGEATLDPKDIYSGSGGCGGSNDVTLEADPDTFNCDDLGENTVQLIVTDNVTGESDTCDAVVTVVDTIAPTCLVKNDTVYLDGNGGANIDFSDIDNGSFDACGEIVDTTLSNDVFDCDNLDAIQEVIVTLTDNNNNTSTCTSEITVLDTISPVCSAIDTLSVYLDASGNASITGSDVDQGSSDQCDVITLSVNPNTFNCDDAGDTLDYILTVTDESGNFSECGGVILVLDTLTQLCNAHDTILVLDENGEGVLDPEDIYSGSGGCGGSNDVTLEADPDTFNCDDLGENTVQLIVTDNVTGESDTCDAIVTVIDTIAPQCLVKNDTVYLDDNGNGSIFFSDIDNGSFDPCGEIVDTTLSQYTFECMETGEVIQDTVTITDNSGNVSICFSEITVLDTIAPVCNAVDTLFISLDSTGMAVITGQTVDDGSYDQCQMISLSVSPDTFYCNDANIPIGFDLTVTDGSGNVSVCSGIVIVEDDISPTITCPNDTTISCLDVPEQSMYSVLFGEPIIEDNCSQGGDYNEEDIVSINNCGEGLITRNFSIVDPSGNSATCTQIITVEAEEDNFDESDITWPQDTIYLENCSTIDPYVLDSYPIVNTDDAGCAVITTTYEDTNLSPGGNCDDTIQRIWTVVDSCKFDADPSTGIYIDTQTVIVFDTLAPEIFAPNDTIIEIEDEDCTGDVYLDLFGYVTDCDPNVVVTNDSPYADDNNSADASGYYPEGYHEITITATDQCGNETIYTYVVNIGFPDYCVKITVYIEEGDSVITYVNEVVSDHPDCIDFSFSNTDPAVDSTVFYCSDLGEVETWVFSFNEDVELLDSCKMLITVDDPNGFCDNTTAAGISGKILTDEGDGVESINVNLKGVIEEKVMSNVNGKFEFDLLSSHQDYIVSPVKKDDILNGVNTNDIIYIQKHLLGIEKLTSPYDIIASDVNNDKKVTASDILNLRKVILGEMDFFINNDSWKFIKSDYVFENPKYPLFENYPQEVVVENLNRKVNVAFVGIKTGDVDNSAIANAMMKFGYRSNEKLELYVDDKYIEKGDVVNVPVRLAKDANFAGMQFTFSFDNKNLEFVEIDGAAIDLADDNVGLRRISKGLFTVSWNTVKSIDFDKESSLFVVNFKAKRSGMLNGLIEINGDITPKLVFGNSGKTMGLDLEFRSKDGKALVLYQNEPNPWSSETSFRFNLPSAGNVKIKITNSIGALIAEKSVEGKEGENRIVIDKNEIKYSGIMFVDFEFEGEHMIKRMIKIR